MGLRTVFAGTSAFAVPSLKALIAVDYPVRAVYTQPDRPAGRGRQLRPSPVKQLALAADLPIRQPASLAGQEAELRSLAPEVMVVAAYGVLLPQTILDIPRHGCVNVHASLLPRWRGAAPIQRAIEAGDRDTGVTIMLMEAGLDTGPILRQARVAIGGEATGGSLHDRLAELGAQELLATLSALATGTLVPHPQDSGSASYARKLSKSEARIDWQAPAVAIERKIRAYDPWPVAVTEYAGTTWRLWRGRVSEGAARAAPGTIIAAGRSGIEVATGEGTLIIESLQLAGGKVLATAEFLNGFPVEVGRVLG